MRSPAGNEYNLRLLDLPMTVRGAVVLLDDGSYDVFINALLCPEARERALRHELRHIDRGHLLRDDASVAFMEREADGETLDDVLTARGGESVPRFYSPEHLRHYLRAYCAQRGETLSKI